MKTIKEVTVLPQNFTDSEQQQARENIGAFAGSAYHEISAGENIDITDYVVSVDNKKEILVDNTLRMINGTSAVTLGLKDVPNNSGKFIRVSGDWKELNEINYGNGLEFDSITNTVSVSDNLNNYYTKSNIDEYLVQIFSAINELSAKL